MVLPVSAPVLEPVVLAMEPVVLAMELVVLGLVVPAGLWVPVPLPV